MDAHPGAVMVACTRDIVDAAGRPLIRGRGRFVDDIAPPGLLHAAFLRSPHAHAAIARIDTAAARAASRAASSTAIWSRTTTTSWTMPSTRIATAGKAIANSTAA